MVKERRSILVLIDNCSSHRISDFSNITFKFLSLNTTALIQPLDQGIIYNFKLNYRKSFLNSIYSINSDLIKTNLKNLNMFDVIEHSIYAWSQVKDTIITNCFKLLFEYG